MDREPSDWAKRLYMVIVMFFVIGSVIFAITVATGYGRILPTFDAVVFTAILINLWNKRQPKR